MSAHSTRFLTACFKVGPEEKNLQVELQVFFEILESFEGKTPLKTPWNTEWFEEYDRDTKSYFYGDDKWLGNLAKEVQYYTDDEIFIFSIPIEIQDRVALENFLSQRIRRPYFLDLAHGYILNMIRYLNEFESCPACNSKNLRYISALLEDLEEDHMSCVDCSGMYSLLKVSQPPPTQRVNEESLQTIIGFAKTILIGTQAGNIYSSRNDERMEQISKPGKGFRLELMLDETIVLGTDKDKQLFRSSDAGGSWELLKFPEPGSVSEIVMYDANLVYIRQGNSIQISRNKGLTWEKTTFTAEHICCSGPSLIFCYGWINNILRSDDAGKSWTGIQAPPHRIHKIIMLNEKEGAFSAGDTHLYTTQDSGKTWQQITHPLNGPVLQLTHDGNGVIAIRGSDNELFYTKNLGKTWQPFPWLTHEPIRTIFADQGYAITRTGSLIKYSTLIENEKSHSNNST